MKAEQQNPFLTANETRIIETLDTIEEDLAAIKDNISSLLSELLKGVEERIWFPQKIKWEQAQGASGPYELSEDPENADFEAMHKDLSAHRGKLTRDGYFYWIFRNGATVGRKQKNTVQGESASG